ncbi:hypothetical protein BC835DRAFT_958436 [Cytidiella melzeri]|nr:hypothetical protein BC835DRAFT_958436 [Cytidiella melzeri]
MSMAFTSELSVWCTESIAVASSSKARYSSPNSLVEASRVKYEPDDRSPMISPYDGAHSGYPAFHPEADIAPHDPSSSSTLTCARSPRQPSRPPTVQPSTAHLNTQTATLFPKPYIQPTRHPQNVLSSINPSFFNDPSDTAGQHGSPSTEHHPPPRASTAPNVPINSHSWTPSHPYPAQLAIHQQKTNQYPRLRLIATSTFRLYATTT